jgi:predicted protein tyrosine phosphatase
VLQFLVYSRKAMEQSRPWPNTAVISITDPGVEAKLAPGDWPVLRLQFWDVDPEKADNERERASLAARAMQPRHAQAIANFVSGLAPGVDTIIVHCEHGRNRSPSVALAMCDDLGLPRSQVGWLGAGSPEAAPNIHVYGLVRRALAALTSVG